MIAGIETTQINKHGSTRDEIRRDAKSLLNRLKSIQADAAFVSEIADLLPQFPLLANERCGTWYARPSRILKPGVYFKSTDGHAGVWDFNLRRYNPHLITTIIDNGGCIIVDSTRKGKRIPDALSKTIPIWCATLNTAIRKCALQNQVKRQQQQAQVKPQEHTHEQDSGLAQHSTGSQQSDSEISLHIPSLDPERWDTRYHSLPSITSRSEHAQIAEKIDQFAEKLMRFTDLTPLTMRLKKPIRPIWLTPQSFLFKDDMPDYSDVAFFPVICLSASRVVKDGMEECDGYLYVQGSGDDEDMWSNGLTPSLFWENEEYLLENGISPEECERRAQEIVRKAKKGQLEAAQYHQNSRNTIKTSSGHDKDRSKKYGDSQIPMVFTPSMELCSEIKPSPIWIGNNASARIPNCWNNGFDMVINCAAEIQRNDLFEIAGNADLVTCLGGNGVGGVQASLCTIQKHQWEASAAVSSMATPSVVEIPKHDPQGKNFYYLHLPIAEGKKGQYQLLEMIPIAVSVVQSIYTGETSVASTLGNDMPSPKILVHCQQGMDRSVGIALALLVSCFDEETGEYCGTMPNVRQVSKEIIQRRLFQIMSHRLAARPSRATLKIINTHFMSPTEPPPAKHKHASALE
ncbi:hypothetical protein BX616_008375 [Lobosporangium transversale]|uniref:tRNA A64-2'-O-ribosylphosphate transferase n=1 Tax=Lobosporangium transversale TaxID=64571 RepID=A0A1Y2G9R4_9FUNG|nr:tRNA A64-2'-O-ribosylphosphate transferase [Lobosporangium transversale]KAF9914406.1 hypothetical protein BX616_008375 [Lobosporangium transversale]ORZ04860.1 tRNA A64-2'-O-ribosylphosphate transferase [Lobosporangium transversale]|eukprot:XP_021876797.1 tRNA A64-2'-O-ribosylphosphate transferase [Lobosporangium transversale]